MSLLQGSSSQPVADVVKSVSVVRFDLRNKELSHGLKQEHHWIGLFNPLQYSLQGALSDYFVAVRAWRARAPHPHRQRPGSLDSGSCAGGRRKGRCGRLSQLCPAAPPGGYCGWSLPAAHLVHLSLLDSAEGGSHALSQLLSKNRLAAADSDINAVDLRPLSGGWI